jgi:hypothetical protein
MPSFKEVSMEKDFGFIDGVKPGSIDGIDRIV